MPTTRKIHQQIQNLQSQKIKGIMNALIDIKIETLQELIGNDSKLPPTHTVY